MTETDLQAGPPSEESDGEYWERYDVPIDLDNPGDSRAVVLGCIDAEPQNVLELGCSTGLMTKVLAERGHRVTAVEIDPVAARLAEPFAEELLVGDLDSVEHDGHHLLSRLAGQQFDMLIAADVLEHLRDPAGCLRRASDLLTPDGKVILSIPNVAHGDVRLALLGGRFDYMDHGLLDRTHVHLFTLKSLLAMIREVGLAPIDWKQVRLPLGASEIELDENLLEFGRRLLSNDPAVETYQWVVTCQKADVAGSSAVWPNDERGEPIIEQAISIMNAPVAHPGGLPEPMASTEVDTAGGPEVSGRRSRLLGWGRDRLVDRLVGARH